MPAMKKYLLTLTLFLATASPAMPADVTGQIVGRFEDTVRTWFLTRDGDQSQSGWRQMVPGLVDVSLWGHDSDTTTTSVKEAMLLDFQVTTTGGSPQVMNATLQFLSEGYQGAWLAVEDQDVTVTIEIFQPSDTGLRIKGSFRANTTYSTDPMKQVMVPSRTEIIEGRFEADLPKD
jgi:hypothetical protein